MMKHLVGVLLLWSLGSGCVPLPFEGGKVECAGDTCTCKPEPRCTGECMEPGCSLACADGPDCDVRCGVGCKHRCTGATNCTTTCEKDCDLECGRVTSCESRCGANCHQRCSDASNCAFTVGAASEVSCQRVGNCNVTCEGACRVDCRETGNCNVTCKETGGSATLCPNGTTRVCGQSC
ncbi:MAG: hypothetical protein ABW123_24815 [Cystobacter sp.]